jgi:hypothetical protein
MEKRLTSLANAVIDPIPKRDKRSNQTPRSGSYRSDGKAGYCALTVKLAEISPVKLAEISPVTLERRTSSLRTLLVGRKSVFARARPSRG